MPDLDALLALEREFFTSDHQISRRSFRHFIRSANSELIVADVAAAIVGAALVNYRRNSTMARLYSIAVAAHFQRRGLARQLLAEAEKKALRRGCRTMRLEVRADDATAVRLYETAGYRLLGRRSRYYAGRIDALRFEKMLASPGRHDSGASLKQTDSGARIGFDGKH